MNRFRVILSNFGRRASSAGGGSSGGPNRPGIPGLAAITTAVTIVGGLGLRALGLSYSIVTGQ